MAEEVAARSARAMPMPEEGAEALKEAARLQAAGVTVFTDTFVARQPRGAGGFTPKKKQYFGELALCELEGVDLMVFAGTTLNQTGQAIEIIGITMAVYLVTSFVTSALMNWYNAHVRIAER